MRVDSVSKPTIMSVAGKDRTYGIYIAKKMDPKVFLCIAQSPSCFARGSQVQRVFSFSKLAIMNSH